MTTAIKRTREMANKDENAEPNDKANVWQSTITSQDKLCHAS